jgi:hypothetical protein
MCKPWCYSSKGDEAPDHQTGSHEQDKCQGHLRDDERILSPDLVDRLGRAACALNSTGNAGPDDRCQSEQEARA